ncbi:MAG TPA: hypothetical protein VFJ16_09430 [Longimicrobium sp.]|nr:hypothetical protein [Longimicrobium sp.]
MAHHQGFRPYPLILALALGGISFSMATAVDSGFTRAWPEWARAAWAFALMAGIVGAVLLFANGVGALTDASLADRGGRAGRVPSLRVYIAVYAGSLFAAVGLALYLEHAYGIPGKRALLWSCGLEFLVASTGRPWWLYQTIRRVGWFSAIESDTAMRVFLGVIGLALILPGLFAPA